MRVVHPAHPLRGQVFPVIQQSGEEVLIRLANGQQYYIPLDWTDQILPSICLPGACFRLADLLALCQRVAALSQKKQNSGTIPSQNNRSAEGDRHATTNPVHFGPAFPGTACPGDRHFGSDHLAPMGPAGRGETQ